MLRPLVLSGPRSGGYVAPVSPSALSSVARMSVDRDAETTRVALLRAGDEDAFRHVVQDWSPGMLRFARLHVATDASAQEVVQDSWLGVLRGLDGFEGRSSLHTWVLRIVINIAKTRGTQERRVVPMDPQGEDGGDDEPAVDPGRFQRSPQRWVRHWTVQGAPHRWDADPARSATRAEIQVLLQSALDRLPARQRQVVVLRDVEGLKSGEVCEVLDLTPANQRVLLHRGRSRVRAALEDYYLGQGR